MNLAQVSLLAGWLTLGLGHTTIAGSADSTMPPATRAVPKPPLPPPPKSPVAAFRELLALDPEHRDESLTNRPAEARQRILAKLREYTSLPPAERELRLRATELRWYLTPLLAVPATNRAALLERVPADLRALVTTRLLLWSITPPGLRAQLLEDDRKMRLYLQLEASSPEQQETLLQAQPPGQRGEIEVGFVRWRALPAEERQKSLDRVNRFFDLNAREKARVLANFPESERRQMEQTLQSFEQLQPDQRARCVRAFGKFASLSPGERAEFLSNARRWEAMTPTERATFRNLVQVAPRLPPTPPRLRVPPLPGSRPTTVTNSR